MAPPDSASGAGPEGPPDYKKLSDDDLAKEIESRIDAGRELDLADVTSRNDMVAVLVADDHAAAEARSAAKTADPPAPPAEEGDAPEDTSGRPDLYEVAAERAENRNPRVIETDVQEEE